MSFHPTPWALLPLAALILVVVVGRHVWRQRREAGAWALLALGAASGWWVFVQIAMLTFGAVDAQMALARLTSLGSASAPLFWFLFAVAYTGRGSLLRGPLGLGAALIPALTISLAFTNASHHLVWTSVERMANAPWLLRIEHGAWFAVSAAWSILLVVVATGVLLWHHAQSPRRRWRVVSVVVAAPAVVALSSALPPWLLERAVWIDLTPTGFALANAVLAWGLLRHGLLVMAPVARTIVVEEMRDAVLVLDRRGHIVDLNRAAIETLVLEPAGPLPIGLGLVWAQVPRRGDGVVAEVSRVRLPVAGGEERSFELTMTPLGPRGGRGSTVFVLRDVTERERMEGELLDKEAALRQANDDLERLANTDSLTGLANRRRFMAALDVEIERALRYARPFALVFLDLDHFKRVNDTHGHGAGDVVLRALGRVLSEASRDIDLAARLGGEEMAMLLPETTTAGALAVAERLRHGVARERHVSPASVPFSVTASLGVAVFGPGTESAEALLQAADQALYAAKAGGRDQVVMAPAPGTNTGAAAN